MRYMVMECHLSYAIVLDEKGRFLKVANMHYEVGQTVTKVAEMQLPKNTTQKKKAIRGIYSFAAMAACLILTVMTLFQFSQSTYASVYMSINPQVRIDVNRKDVVVGLEGVNGDGKELVADYRYKSKQLELVMDELVDKAIEMNYLHEGGQITLTLDSDSSEWVVRHSDTLTSSLYKHLSEKLSVTIDITDTDAEKKTKEQNETEKIVIPVRPQETEYGESDYGNPIEDTENDQNENVSGSSEESDYTEGLHEDESETDYEDRQKDNDPNDEDSPDDGVTDYEARQTDATDGDDFDSKDPEEPEVSDNSEDFEIPEDSDNSEDNDDSDDD